MKPQSLCIYLMEQEFPRWTNTQSQIPKYKISWVHLSSDLKWNCHIDKITSRANRALGFVKRNLRVKSRTLNERAYLSLVQPQIEYCSSIWDPRKGIESNGNYKIEMVQRRATRWTLSNYDPKASVMDMLTNLGWQSLQHRRVDTRPSLLYKIAHNLTPSCHKDQLRPPRRRSRHVHEQFFLPISCSSTSHRLSFFPQTISQWNNLPHHVFSNCNSLNHFRNRTLSLQHIPVNVNFIFFYLFHNVLLPYRPS